MSCLLMCFRRSPRTKVRRPRSLPRRYQPLRYRDGCLPHAEAQPVHEWRVRHRQDEEVQHLPQFQLHGPATGLRTYAGPQKPVRQSRDGSVPAIVLHNADQPQRLSVGPARVHVKSGRDSPLLNLETCVSIFSTPVKMLLIELAWDVSRPEKPLMGHVVLPRVYCAAVGDKTDLRLYISKTIK